MSVSLILTLSLIYIVLLFVAVLFNHFKERRDLFVSSVFLLGMSTIAHLGNYLWLKSLPLEAVLGIHYLFFAGVQVVIAAGLFYLNREKLRVIMTITIVLLVAEAILGYAVHLDRNVMALNGALIPNAAGSTKWLLWDLRNYTSLASAFTMLLSVTLPNIYQVRTDMHPVDAYDIQEKVKAYLDKFKPSRRVNRVDAFLNVSGESLCFFDTEEDGEGTHRAEIGIILLNEAIKICCYEPHRTKPVGMFGRFVYWLRS